MKFRPVCFRPLPSKGPPECLRVQSCLRKRAYATIEEAKSAAYYDQKPYRCGFCGMYHRATRKKKG